MDELAERRKKLFAGAAFKTALFYSGDSEGRQNANFQYFSGCAIDGCYLALKPGGGKILAHEMNFRMAKAICRYPSKLLGKDRAGGIRKEAGRGRVGFAPGEMAASRFLALKKAARLRLVDAGGKAYSVRGKKSGSERLLMAESAKIARGILERLDPWEFKTESELADGLKIAALKKGAEISFEPIVATGRNSAFPHHIPTAKRLSDAVLVDFGVRYKGYCSDFTRCYYRKKGRETETYEACKGIFDEILDGLPDCEKGKDVSALSDRLFKRHRLPSLVHAIGHGIGLEVHEYPHLGKKSQDSLEGAVLAIEPAAYFSNYGVRFEEMLSNSGKSWKKL